MPVLACAVNESAIPLFPSLPAAIAALQPLGRITAIDDEGAFTTASALGAWFGWLFALTGETADILIDGGMNKTAARQVTADMMRAAGAMIAARPERDPMQVLQDLATPGGITEIGLQALQKADAFRPWRQGMAAAIERLQALGR